MKVISIKYQSTGVAMSAEWLTMVHEVDFVCYVLMIICPNNFKLSPQYTNNTVSQSHEGGHADCFSKNYG